MMYLGDFAEDATLYIPFNTFSSDDPAASVTVTNLVDADIKVHKDGGTTEIVTDGATIAIDYDGITGNHLITIDTSVHADYATGSDYMVRLEGVTVDGGTLNAWVAIFSIENRFMRGTDSAATATALSTAQSDLDTLTGSDGATLATSQPNYAPATAAALTTHDGKLDTVDANIDTLLTRITSTLFSGITSMAEWLGLLAGKQVGDTTARTEIRATGAGSGTFDETVDSLEAVRDRGDAAWTTGAGGTPPQLLQSTTIATLAGQTTFTLTAGSTDDDAYNGAVVIITDQATATQKAVGTVSDYVGSTKGITLTSDPGIFTIATGDTVDILAAISNAPTVGQITADIDANSTQLAAIVADTNELQTNQGNWLTATGFSTHDAAAVVTAIGDGSTLTAASVDAYNNLITAMVSPATTYRTFRIADTATALATYDGVTRTEATADKDEVLAVANALPTLPEIMAGGDIDGFSVEETLKLCLAALAGKLSGAATTTITIRSAADDANRITATVDADGNRSAITLNTT